MGDDNENFQDLNEKFLRIDAEIEEIMKLFREDNTIIDTDGSFDTDRDPTLPYNLMRENCVPMVLFPEKDNESAEVEKDISNFVDDKCKGGGSKLGNGTRRSLGEANYKSFKRKRMPSIFTNEFQNGLVLNFGEDNLNAVGQTRSLPFLIKSSPDETEDLELEITCIPSIKGIHLVIEDPSSSVLQSLTPTRKKREGIDGSVVESIVPIEKGGEVKLWVTWNPVEPGNILENILLVPGKEKQALRVTISGWAGSTNVKRPPFLKTPSRSNRSQLRSAVRNHLSPIRVTPVRPTPRTPKSKTRLSIPEEWAEKQTTAFTAWLNHLFCPSPDVDGEHELRVPKADDVNSALGKHVIYRRLARSKTTALQVFQSHEMKKVRLAIESEIKNGRFSLRIDRDVNADLIQREKVVSILLSYSTQWLRVGLETLFGESISRDVRSPATPMKKSKEVKNSKTNGMRSALKNFIVNRVLSDSETLGKYTRGRCGTPSGSFEKKYRAEMRALILTRLLILVIFLDKAKIANALDDTPCLFLEESKCKSTSDVLIKICRECLSSEGNIIKHLSRIDIQVSYKQKPIDELDFTVSNLAADIRDGLRLTRLAEILSNAPRNTLLAKLRIPVVSRFQKLHNVGIVLSQFEGIGARDASEISAHHIVDGHREQVLQLLWTIASQCGIPFAIDRKIVEDEIKRVKSSKTHDATKWALRDSDKSHTPQRIDVHKEFTLDQNIKATLIRWCSEVTSKFGIQVNDMTRSFDDGIVLCLLIHYYHPSLLCLNDIKPTSRHGICGNEATENENSNICLALTRISELGGVPKFLEVDGSQNKTEEKSMFLCLTYLCSRLIESSIEIHACITIQRWHRERKDSELTRKKIDAANKIWKAWMANKDAFYLAQRAKFGKSVEVIERFILARMSMLQLLHSNRVILEGRRQNCATIIQAYVRRDQSKKRFLRQREELISVRAIQRSWRCHNLNATVMRSIQQKKSALIIQTTWRRHIGSLTFSRFLFRIIKLQAWVRVFLLKKRTRRSNNAATNIQRIWRGFGCQILYQIDMIDILTAQRVARRFIAEKKFQRSLKALLILQCFIRRVTAKREFSKLVLAAISAEMEGRTSTQFLKLLMQAKEQKNV
mmetsp:Transcript_4767/g.7432  ORF Transcript_4767/g.7432 Transcript_4767/m.7432 type:complete len:1121 (-) Transcript_4767:244-3606(-)